MEVIILIGVAFAAVLFGELTRLIVGTFVKIDESRKGELWDIALSLCGGAVTFYMLRPTLQTDAGWWLFVSACSAPVAARHLSFVVYRALFGSKLRT